MEKVTCSLSYQVEMDRKFCEQLAERYKPLDRVIFVEERLDMHSIQSIYSNAYMTFSNRLHVLMLAMAFGSIPIAVIDRNNHNKITGIFQDANLSEMIIDISEKEISLEKLLTISENADRIREELLINYRQTRQQGKELLRQVMTETTHN